MTRLRTLIVDDEPLARRNLRALLKPHADIEILAECGSGREALELLQSREIDLLFLDVQMPEMNGFQVLENLDTPRMPAIIFVTAYDEFAIKAFDVSATDYLLKPVEDKRFEQALSRVKHRAAAPREVDEKITKLAAHRAGDRPYPSRLLIRTNSRVLFLPVEEIDYIESEDYYSAIHVGAKTHLLREPIKELEGRLDPAMFLRIHRSAIVNVRRIKELRSLTSGGHDVHLLDGTVLKLSRSRWDAARDLLAGV